MFGNTGWGGVGVGKRQVNGVPYQSPHSNAAPRLKQAYGLNHPEFMHPTLQPFRKRQKVRHILNTVITAHCARPAQLIFSKFKHLTHGKCFNKFKLASVARLNGK